VKTTRAAICVALAITCTGCGPSIIDNGIMVRKLAVAGRCEAAWKIYEVRSTPGWTDDELLKYCPARPGLTP